MVMKILGATALIVSGIFGYTAITTDRYADVYEPVNDYKVQRYTDASGRDTIKFWMVIDKKLTCDVERGNGPVWVDLIFEDNYVTASALYNSKSEIAGRTRGKGGDKINVDGYFFIGKTHDVEGADIPLSTASINVPCELTVDDRYRQVIAKISPIQIPRMGETLVFGDGYKPEKATVK